MTRIDYIIDGHRYWDRQNGNSYYLTRITRTSTGKSIVLNECPGNCRHYILELRDDRAKGRYYDRSRIHEAPLADMTYREWRRMLSSDYWRPADQYKRTRRGNQNITVALIRALSRGKTA